MPVLGLHELLFICCYAFRFEYLRSLVACQTPGFLQFCCSTEEVRAALAAAKVFSFVSG
jgi:hypothetical protein